MRKRMEPCLAVGMLERAMRLSPLDPEMGYALSGLGLAHLVADEPSVALAYLQRATQEMPTWTPALQFLVVVYGWLGRAQEANDVTARLMRLMPRLTVHPGKWVFRPSCFRDRFLQSLHEAGVPAGAPAA